MENFNTLNSCDETIKTACTMDKGILNDTITAKFNICLTTFNDLIVAIESNWLIIKTATFNFIILECRIDDVNVEDGTAACACWSKIAEGKKIFITYGMFGMKLSCSPALISPFCPYS